MEIKIEYCDGTIIELVSVESIKLISSGPVLLIGSIFEIQTFGNGPITHRKVINLDIIGW
jgi:hypothetical protein